MPRSTILVTGATGLLGPYLLDAAREIGEAQGLARSGADIDCDLADAAAVAEAIGSAKPSVVIHAAAFTDVDGCERDPERADLVNHRAVAHITAALPAASHLIYVSTDQVYADVPGPHAEGEEQPVNVYGRSKLAGEGAARRHPRSTVVRTNLFGAARSDGRQSLSDFVIRGLRDGRAITLFRDVYFSPLHMRSLSAIITEMVGRNIFGTLNVGSRAGMSKRDFGHRVAQHLGLSTASAMDGVSSAVPGRAPRPRDLRLDVRRIEGALGRAMPTCDEEIRRL